MLPADPEVARSALLPERERALADLAGTVVAPDPMTYGSQAAAATQVFEQQRDLAPRDRARQHLAMVDAALARFADGSWGTCPDCAGAIAAERLEALPWAARCIVCQRAAGRPRS